MYKVLSIDGGGVRGVIPAVLLRHIERETGRAISEIFDLIVGTSTGGLIATGLNIKGDGGRPKYSADDMLNFFKRQGNEIFKKPFLRALTSINGFSEELYDQAPLEKILNDYCQNDTLTDCIKPMVLTSYDIERRKPYFFKTRRAEKNPDRNHFLRDAVRATSAAPMYFEPAEVKSLANNDPTRRALVDGGVFVSNPALCAYVEAIDMGAPSDEILLLSLGTGMTNREIPFDEAKGWGYYQWGRPLVGVVMDGQSDATDHQLRRLLPGKNKDQKKGKRYFRFDIELNEAQDDFDDASAGNLANLQRKAEQIISEQGEDVARLVKKLNRPAPAPAA